MISVLNHLLPLNGSKQVTYILIPLFFVLFSCRTTKSVTYTPEVVPIVKPNQPIIEDTIDTPIVVTDVDDPVKEDSIDIEIKEKYSVALLLPFNLDKQNYHPSDVKEAKFDRPTKMAIEFYQGFQMAINEIEKSDIGIEIHVFDTKNEEFAVKQILGSEPFPKVDLIIGPVYNKNLRVTADYCAKRKIPMISPLSSSTTITKDNPYYYSANATSTSHYEAMLTHLHKKYPEDTLHIIHGNTVKEREVINDLKAINNSVFSDNPTVILEIPVSVDDEVEEIKSQFDSLATHLVFIPSSNESFATYTLSQLANIKTYFPSIVFGMSNWSRFKNINYDYFEWLQVHFTQSYWVNEFNMNVSNFDRSFKYTYKMDPTDYAYQGYDLANFVLNALASNNQHFNTDKDRFFSIDPSESGLQSKFKFIPRIDKNSTGTIDYWDNSYIQILKFENYMYNKID